VRPPRTIDEVVETLPKGNLPRLPSPEYNPDKHPDPSKSLMLAVESMKEHSTSEGWELALALRSAGWTLAGRRYRVTRPNSSKEVCDYDEVSVPRLLQEVNPGTVLVQDKLEWDRYGPSDFRPDDARFEDVYHLSFRPDVFKLIVRKDAQSRWPYNRQSAEEIGCHAWLVYYHPKVVCRMASFVRPEHCVRVRHTIDKDKVPSSAGGRLMYSISPSGTTREWVRKDRALLSGALGIVYPLRSRIASAGLPLVDVLRHPGYGLRGSFTDDYLKILSGYKVAICTTSIYGYTLRKLIEATACGCRVITDLPIDDPMEAIDGNFVRVHPSITNTEMTRLVAETIRDWDAAVQSRWAKAAVETYDYRVEGVRLAEAIERARRMYPCPCA
jgi:hypothetical protein